MEEEEQAEERSEHTAYRALGPRSLLVCIVADSLLLTKQSSHHGTAPAP